MGRALNKKYFGNRNVGTNGLEIDGVLSNSQNYADDHIGGEGIASINWSNLGSFRGNNGAHNPLVGFELPAPTIPGGVQATWTAMFEVATVTTGAGSVGLVVGDTYTYAGLGSPVFTVATSGNNGTNATFTVTNRGSFDISAMPGDTTGVNITKVSGSGASTFLVDINFRVQSTEITEKGSGYTGNETFTVTLYSGAAGTVPAGTIVVTTDSGNVGSNTNQENAIIIRANTSGGGSTGKVGDIIKQVSTRRYKVRTADGYGIVEIGTDSTPATGYGYIVATSASGATYYVTKLTAHRATLSAKTGDGALDGQAVGWSFASPSGSVVQIENA
jgi:hypothetical protein